MAFLHLLNCVLLTFAPIFVILNSTSLQEYGAKACIGGLLGYIGTSMVKLVAYASLVPTSDEWSIITEVLKESISILDIIALERVFTWKTFRVADKKTRILGVGLGWAAGELILSHLLIFIVNAGSGEFSWEYLNRSINANCSLFQLIILAYLVFIRSTTGGASYLLASSLILTQILVRPLAISYFLHTGLSSI